MSKEITAKFESSFTYDDDTVTLTGYATDGTAGTFGRTVQFTLSREALAFVVKNLPEVTA